MKINVTLNGVKVSREIPVAWHECKFRHYLKLMEAGSDINKIISVFTDIDPDTIKKAEIKNFEVVVSALSFMQTAPNMIFPVSILGYPMPPSLTTEAAARYGDMQEIAKTFKQDDPIGNVAKYPQIVSIYLCPSPYDYIEAQKLAEQLQDAPCVEVMAAANFIFKKLRTLNEGTRKTYPPEDTRLSRLKRGLTNWLQRLVFTILYSSWRKKHPLPEKSSSNGPSKSLNSTSDTSHGNGISNPSIKK